MHTLRLTQHSTGENQYKVEISLEGGQFRQSAVSEFEFSLSPQDQESIRWYLEDYPLYRHDPAPKIADRVEERMAEIGRELFRHVFQSSDDARDIWADLRREVNSARVEIVAEVREATAIPWELLRDPKTDTCLALHAAAFVHSDFRPARPFRAVEDGEGPIRILLAICRPSGRYDVPFRSVASQLIKGLADADRDLFQLDVLRPATYQALNEKLRQAKAESKPYHVVHFDGHGTYDDIMARYSNLPPKKKRGYLLFEHTNKMGSFEYIHGEMLGKTLSENDVPVLLLNACRSAHSEAQKEPIKKNGGENAEVNEQTPGDQTRAFGSLAQEIVNAGTAGVVAMRYNVYVVTAAQFVADLYGSLIAGNPLGKAVTLGRKALSANPMREITGDDLALQDWCVPVVYEAGPIALFPEQTAEKPLKITLTDSRATPPRGHLDPDLPPTPDAGFWGRDETLLALDRAFDDHGVVLLHAYAGSGKTAAVAEFARWYALTGGVAGPVLFTSFEQYKPLARVLDKFGQVFGPTLEQQLGINWLARSDDERRDIALQVMGQVPVLWIWDNVEPVAGFPTGAASAWSADEQKELADFLRAARETKAKFLLTSRRNETPWLGGLPVRITLPAMPMHEREQMARGLAKKHGRRLRDLKAWRPLLRFTDGNPLTLTVLVGQALRDGLTAEAQVEGFVEKLSRGETAFEDEETEGRTKSLAASLNYGFENAFSEDERKILALLYFFQGFVNVQVLQAMGNPELDHPLPVLRNQTRGTLTPLLDRAAEVGMLTALGDGVYAIHPVLPWFFKKLLERFYPEDSLPIRAFVEAIGTLSRYYCNQYGAGNSDTIVHLALEEHNINHARRIARINAWWNIIFDLMQGLYQIYNHTGRLSEWKHIVEEISPDILDPETDGPLHHREDQWNYLIQYRVLLAMEERNWARAEHLQKIKVNVLRKQIASRMEKLSDKLRGKAQNDLHSLMVSLNFLGNIQREMNNAECVVALEESFDLSKKIGEQYGQFVDVSCALELGHAYKDIPAIRNLEKAEQWYRRSFELCDETNWFGRSASLGQLGFVAFEQFQEARAANKSNEELEKYINTALRCYQRALEITPWNAVNDLAIMLNQLGNIYASVGDIDSAMEHWRKSISYKESAANHYGAGTTCYNIAITLAREACFTDALDYARAALRNYEMYGDRAAADIERTKGLILRLSELG